MSYRVVDIKDYWANVVSESLEFKVIADAENPEFNYMWEKIYGLVDEFFVVYATEYGISRMEKILKIVPPHDSTLDQRRDQILWKLNLRLPYTMRFLKNILTSIVGEENRIVDYDNDSRVITIKVREGLTDMSQLKRDLNKMLPSNLVLNLEVY